VALTAIKYCHKESYSSNASNVEETSSPMLECD